jgi:predicted RND superfamily exporter protein
MVMEIQLVSSMYQGLYISIAFALFALLVATGNIIQAFLAAFTIGLVIINVMAFVAYNKWQLGSAECVSIVVCVGFAVDYVVHLASHYVHSEFDDRENRMRDSLREMGISILSGAITTILATITLFICVLMLFSKFAIFVIMTTLFSVVYSLGFFSALCLAIGPTGT